MFQLSVLTCDFVRVASPPWLSLVLLIVSLGHTAVELPPPQLLSKLFRLFKKKLSTLKDV